MKILFLSGDRSLLDSQQDIPNFTKERFRRYSKYAKCLVIVHATKDKKLAPWFENGISAVPTDGFDKLSSFIEMWKSGKRWCNDELTKPDLIVSQDPFLYGFIGEQLAKEFQIPHQTNYLSSLFDNPYWLQQDFKNHLFNRIGKGIIKRADSVRCECESQKKHLEVLGVSSSKIVIAPLIVSKIKGNGKAIREKYYGKKIILFVGRNSWEKNIPLLKTVARQVNYFNPEALFLVVGNHQPFYLDYLISIGRKTPKELADYYDACEFLVLTSRYEGIPLVAVEAMLAGKPIVSTKTWSIQDLVIDGKEGYLFSQHSPAFIGAAIRNLLRNPDRLKQMGKNAKIKAESMFSEGKTLIPLLNSWGSLVRK